MALRWERRMTYRPSSARSALDRRCAPRSSAPGRRPRSRSRWATGLRGGGDLLEQALGAAGVALPDTLAELAERIRQITVRVHGRSSGYGSGVIWRPDGHIVTNAHVAHRFATVVLPDERAFRAEVSGWDPERDLAMIKVDAGLLPAAAIGDAASLRPGDLVFASGHPFGGARALTAGIVHAVRSRGGSRGSPWVEADVRVGPGDSGGPLVEAITGPPSREQRLLGRRIRGRACGPRSAQWGPRLAARERDGREPPPVAARGGGAGGGAGGRPRPSGGFPNPPRTCPPAAS